MNPHVEILNEWHAGELFRLRRCALLDAPLAFLASPEDDVADSEAAVREMLSGGSDSVVFGAHAEGLIGMLGFYRLAQKKAAHKCNLWGLYVAPQWRRQGVAARLLEAAIRHAQTLPGLVSVHLSVSESAGAARSLYEKLGFETWGLEPDALRVESSSAAEHHMRLLLTRGS
jgi:ribosomal protein S18 acetylase RimI-like enzyme